MSNEENVLRECDVTSERYRILISIIQVIRFPACYQAKQPKIRSGIINLSSFT